LIRSGAETRGPFLLGLLLAGLSSFVPGWAQADDLAQARRHFAEGQRHYGTGDWARAFAAYEAAYEAAPLPDLLFNMGQCQRKLGDAAAALDLFRRFLSTSPPAESRSVVMDLVRELEVQPAPAPPPAEPEPLPPPETEPAREEPRERVVTRPPVQEPAPSGPSRGGPTAAFYLAAGSGAAALIAAGVLTTLAEVGRADFLDRVEAGQLEQAEDGVGATEALYAARNVTAIVSAAALVGAAVLLLVDSGSDGADGANPEVGLALATRLTQGGILVEGGGRW
jgi:tetratricopeptide (TPR) repeat protein